MFKECKLTQEDLNQLNIKTPCRCIDVEYHCSFALKNFSVMVYCPYCNAVSFIPTEVTEREIDILILSNALNIFHKDLRDCLRSIADKINGKI